MNDIFIGLAVWRVSLMLVKERGLFSILEWMRDRISDFYISHMQYWDSDGKAVYPISKIRKVLTSPLNELVELLECVWCMSIWIGGIACYLAHRPIWVILVYSAISVLAQSYVDRN